MNFNFKTKLKLLGFVTLAGLGLLTVITLSGLKSIEEAQETAHRRKSYVIDLLEVKASAISTILLNPIDQETQKIFAEAESKITQHGKTAITAIVRIQIKEELKQILNLWVEYDRDSQELLRLATTDSAAANEKLPLLYHQKFKPFQQKLEQFVDIRQKEAEQAKKAAVEISDKIYWESTALLILVILANILVVSNLSRSLKEGLLGIQQNLIPLKAGDLTKRLPVNNQDELSEIAAGVNEFVSEVQKIVGVVRQDANQVASAAAELATASAQVFASSNHQSEATATVAATTEEFSVSIDEVSCHATEAENQARKYAELSRQGGNDVQSAVVEIERIEQAVNKSVTQMQALSLQAHEISSIVKVIKDVADQTNLLALNAAIEAARAGESGRGFSVVADEVRNLAARTSKSTQEITNMIVSIQAHTDSASKVMEEGNERVAVGVKQAEQAVNSMRQINENSDQVMRAISDISLALREQRIAGTEIAKNIEYISQMTETNGAAVSQISAAAVKLEELSHELKLGVSRFSV